MSIQTSEVLPEAIKPAVMLWVLPYDALRMSLGNLPSTWYNYLPPDPTKYIQIIVPCDYFAILWDKRNELNQATADLPF